MPMSQYGDAALMAAFDQRVQEIVAKAIAAERAACERIALGHGCGRDGCTECIGGAIAASIRARSDNPN